MKPRGVGVPTALVFNNNSVLPANLSNWKIKSFPRNSLLRLKRSRSVYKFFDFRAWKLLTAQQTIKFKKFKSTLLNRFFVKAQVHNASNISNSAYFQKIGLFRLQKQIKRSFSFFWFSRPNLHFENKLLYLKKKRLSSSYKQKIAKRLRYKAIYTHRNFYSKNFINYFAALSVEKKKRLARYFSKKPDVSSTSFFLQKLYNYKKAIFFTKRATTAQKAIILGCKNGFNTIFKKKLIETGDKLSLGYKQQTKLNNIKKARQIRASSAFFGSRKLFFSNDRILPNYNFVLTITATNSNMYANVSDIFGKTIFYHTMRRVGFQTGGSSKRSSKVAVERLGIFVGKQLKSKRFFNKRFLVVFRGVTWRRRFILKYIRFGAKRKIKIVGIIERSGLPHNGCKLKKRKHKRKSFLKLHRIKKKFRVRTIKRVFKEFSRRPVYLKKKTQKFIDLIALKREARLKYIKVFRRRPFYKKFYIKRILKAIKVLRAKKNLFRNKNLGVMPISNNRLASTNKKRQQNPYLPRYIATRFKLF